MDSLDYKSDYKLDSGNLKRIYFANNSEEFTVYY